MPAWKPTPLPEQASAPGPAFPPPSAPPPSAPPPMSLQPGAFPPAGGQFTASGALPPGPFPQASPPGGPWAPVPGATTLVASPAGMSGAKRRRHNPVLVAALSVLAAISLVVGGATVASVALPAYLNHRAEAQWKATTISLPDHMIGLHRQQGGLDLSSVDGLEFGEEDGFGGPPMGTKSAVYSGGAGSVASQPVVLVMAYRFSRYQTSAQQEHAMAASRDSLVTSGVDITLVDRDAGRLGGHLACGATEGGSVCVSVDAAAQVVMIVRGVLPGGLDTLASIRAQVEHRS